MFKKILKLGCTRNGNTPVFSSKRSTSPANHKLHGNNERDYMYLWMLDRRDISLLNICVVKDQVAVGAGSQFICVHEKCEAFVFL